MRDTSFIIALVALLFLGVAALAWFRIIRKPDQQPPTRKDDRRGGRAAMVIVVGFGLSALAAIIAVIGWILR
jgi:hypothetical protein